jgi:hypothetical protein
VGEGEGDSGRVDHAADEGSGPKHRGEQLPGEGVKGHDGAALHLLGLVCGVEGRGGGRESRKSGGSGEREARGGGGGKIQRSVGGGCDVVVPSSLVQLGTLSLNGMTREGRGGGDWQL